jgi:hypothetical protein
MKKIKLRPHHIEAILNNKILSAKEHKRLIESYTCVYGKSFTESYLEFMSRINTKTRFKVVLGNDFVCDSLKCPYRIDCGEKNYQKVAESIIEKIPKNQKDVAKSLGTSNPDIDDEQAIKRYNLVIGNTYCFGDITTRFFR